MKLEFLINQSSRITTFIIKSSMILSHVSTSIAIQYEQQTVTNDYISQAVQCEKQNYLSCGTQSQIATETKGVQCSLEEIPVLFKSRSSQYNRVNYISKSTQWSPEDASRRSCSNSSNSSHLCAIPADVSGSADTSEYITCHSRCKQNLFLRENSTPTSHKRSLNLEETQMLRKDTNVKKVQILKPGKKNLSASTLFGSIIRQRKDTYASSTTSGVTEMYSSRSGLESVDECEVSVQQPVQILKQKKKHLWTPSRDSVASISGSEDSLDFSSLYPKMEETFPKRKWKSNRPFSVQSRSKYTSNEELAVIKYISENNLYNHVRGVTIWQDMESEIKINRTWQSLKEHFRKKILPNINEFDLPKKVEESFHRIIMR